MIQYQQWTWIYTWLIISQTEHSKIGRRLLIYFMDVSNQLISNDIIDRFRHQISKSWLKSPKCWTSYFQYNALIRVNPRLSLVILIPRKINNFSAFFYSRHRKISQLQRNESLFLFPENCLINNEIIVDVLVKISLHFIFDSRICQH